MPRQDEISEAILSEIGWDDGMRIPVANAKNKALEEEVISAKRQVEALNAELTENSDRLNAVSDHLKNVRNELQNTQSLYAARKMELESEDHLKKISVLEEGRIKQELQRIEREMADLDERKNLYQNNRYRQEQRMDELKAQMDWDQKALDAWLEECAHKDDDSMMIQKYSRQDEAKIKELTLKISHQTDELHKQRRNLKNEVTETNLAQMILDKTAEQFRVAHAERQDLLAQWEATIEQMQRRDTEMELLATQLLKIKAEVRDAEAQYKEKEEFYENEKANNRDYEEKINVAERTAGKVRTELLDNDKQLSQFRSELDALKRQVDRTAADLEAGRAEVTQLKKELVSKAAKLEQVKKTTAKLELKLKRTLDAKLTAEERAALMDRLLAEEEKNQAAMTAELAQLRTLSYKKSQRYNELVDNMKIIDADIHGAGNALRNYKLRIRTKDDISLRQQEAIYAQDFQIQMLERRLSRMKGEMITDDQTILEARMIELKGQVSEKVATHSLLVAQMKRIQDDLRKVRRDLERSAALKADLTLKIEEVNLHNDNATRALKKSVCTKQEKMVEENMLKLDLKRLRDALYQKADEVLTQEKFKLKLETAMKERQQEIRIHVDMLRQQMRTADAERAEINAELHDRVSKIDKLKKRFEILTFSMSAAEGDEELSQAYYVIKAAQEKEELQREGDELDAKVRKAEKELAALNNTLRLMTTRNDAYRKSFNKVPASGEAVDEKTELEEKLKAVSEKFRYKRRQVQELREDLQAMSNILHGLDREEETQQELLTEKETRMAQLQRELDEQQVKIDRVTKLNSKYSREVRAAAKTKDETPEERDFEIRELRELTKEAMKQMSDVVQKHPEISKSVHLYFSQTDLPPLDTLSRTPGGGIGSRGSSTSTLSSVRSTATAVSGRSFVTQTSRGSLPLGGPGAAGGAAGTAGGARVQAASVNIGADFIQKGTEAHGASEAKSRSSAGRKSDGTSRSSNVGAGPSPVRLSPPGSGLNPAGAGPSPAGPSPASTAEDLRSSARSMAGSHVKRLDDVKGSTSKGSSGSIKGSVSSAKPAGDSSSIKGSVDSVKPAGEGGSAKGSFGSRGSGTAKRSPAGEGVEVTGVAVEGTRVGSRGNAGSISGGSAPGGAAETGEVGGAGGKGAEEEESARGSTESRRSKASSGKP